MMKQIVTVLLVVSALFAACMAQTKATAKPDAQKVPALLPGLDKSLIDTTADPCTDFFKYACGNFSRLHPIPNDRSAYGTGAMVADHTEYVLHAMLEKAAAGGAARTPNEQKIGDSYAACMDVDTINQKALTPLQMEFDRINALKSKDELPELMARFQLIGVTAFLNFGEQQDFKDARKQIAFVDQSGLGLPERDYYFRTGAAADKTRAQYVQHIINMFKLTGESEKKATSDAEAIMKLETALAQVSMDITSRRDPNKVYHLMPVTELSALAPAIAWDRFLAASGAPKISELNVTNPDFVKGMNSLIADTNLETIKTYLRWQLILATPGYVLPKPMDEERFDFYGHKLSGQPEQRARYKRCVQATDAALGEALGQVYVAQEFSPANKQATLQMVQDIEAAMDKDIDTLDWMSSATKVRAKEKLRAVADKIGYPDHWRDYSTLTIVRDDAFGNVRRATAFENRRQLAKIGKPGRSRRVGDLTGNSRCVLQPQHE